MVEERIYISADDVESMFDNLFEDADFSCCMPLWEVAWAVSPFGAQRMTMSEE